MIINNADIEEGLKALILQLTAKTNYFYGTKHEFNLKKYPDLPYIFLEIGQSVSGKFTPIKEESTTINVYFLTKSFFTIKNTTEEIEPDIIKMRQLADELVDILMEDGTLEDSYTKDNIYHFTDNDFNGILLKAKIKFYVGQDC
jgi:hypothetical protein